MRELLSIQPLQVVLAEPSGPLVKLDLLQAILDVPSQSLRAHLQELRAGDTLIDLREEVGREARAAVNDFGGRSYYESGGNPDVDPAKVGWLEERLRELEDELEEADGAERQGRLIVRNALIELQEKFPSGCDTASYRTFHLPIGGTRLELSFHFCPSPGFGGIKFIRFFAGGARRRSLELCAILRLAEYQERRSSSFALFDLEEREPFLPNAHYSSLWPDVVGLCKLFDPAR
jgi:hypothetical protein